MEFIPGFGIVLGTIWLALAWLPAGMDGHTPLPYLIALRRFLWMPLIACAIVAVMLGSNTAFLLVALTLLSFDSRVTGRLRVHEPAPSISKHSGETSALPVMTLNCRYGRADAAAIVRTVREQHICVLALQELTGELVEALSKAGLDALLPHHRLGEAKTDDNGGFNGIWTADQPTESVADAVDIPAADVPSLTIHGIRFVSAHTKSPMRSCRDWSSGLLGLRALADHPLECPTVLMGDLNANVDHPSFRALLGAGFRDVASPTQPTFPRWLTWPRITLDHILLTAGLAGGTVDTSEIPGSDHLALSALVAKA